MDTCLESLDVEGIKEFYRKFETQGKKKEKIRAIIERALVTRAFLIGPTYPIEDVENFLQFVITLAKEGMCAVSFTIQVLQDMFDVSVIKRCEKLFTIVEKNIAIFKTDFFFNPCKNLILRMCNDLLKRLSRTVNTAFCGRIIVLLAKSLPLNERSGLNLPGHFNVDNVTVYERDENKIDDISTEANEDDEDRDEGELPEKDATVTINYALYLKFWEIQAFFVNPALLNDAETFRKFENNLNDVFTFFFTHKLQRTTSSTKTTTVSDGRVTPAATTISASAGVDELVDSRLTESATESNFVDNCSIQMDMELDDDFVAKYLTSQKLFHLQLADVQFRRYFLVQCLILVNYLGCAPKTKDIFSTKQEGFLKEVSDKCYSLLKETYPHGSHFTESIKRILLRERAWISWKSDGCTDIVEPRMGRTCLAYKQRAIAKFDPDIIDLCNPALTRLWNINPNNLDSCLGPERDCVPNLKKFVEDGLEELDPEQQVEEACKSVNNENYQWMASRFLLHNSDHYLNCASLEIKAASKPTAKFLEQAIHITALNIPDMKERAEQIQQRIKAIEEEKEAELIRKAEEEARRNREAAEEAARREAEARAAAASAAAKKAAMAAEKAAIIAAEKAAAAERARKEAESEQQQSSSKSKQRSEKVSKPATVQASVEQPRKKEAERAGIPRTNDHLPSTPPTTTDAKESKDDIGKGGGGSASKKRKAEKQDKSLNSTFNSSSSSLRRVKEEPLSHHDLSSSSPQRKSARRVNNAIKR